MPGPTLLLIPDKVLDDIGIHAQTFHESIDRLDDGLTKTVEMRIYLPFFCFLNNGFLSTAQLRNTHRKLNHPSVEKRVRVIENNE